MRAADNVFVGIPGPELDTHTSALLAEHQPGGIVLFGRNIKEPEQLQELVTAIRRVLPEAVLAVDAEGGRVDRMKDIVGPAPSGAVLAAHPPSLALQAGTWVRTTTPSTTAISATGRRTSRRAPAPSCAACTPAAPGGA
jgi:beta-glucosidase-like glycosyl hydrolase